MGKWTNTKIKVSYGPDNSDLGRPAEPMRGNDGSFILMGGEGDNRTRVAVVDFQGEAKRGEAWRTPDPVGLSNAHRLAACWNAMTGIEDPAAFMEEVREVLDALEDYFDNRADADQAPGDTPTPNEEMLHQVTIRALLAKMEGE